MTTTDRDTNEPADIDPQTLRNSLAWGEFVNQFVGAENVPTPIPPADVCPKRLTPEREYELREYLRRIFDPRSTGYDGYPYPEDRDRAMLLAEIDTLRAERDKLAAELERLGRERDAAISLLGQYNSNQGGLRLNGKAIGWHRDPIAGFVAGIGGSKVIYPTILAAIRAALAALDQPAEGEKGNGNGT